MSLFQITSLVLLCICVAANLIIVYIDRVKWINAFAAGLCAGAILDLISDIICK